MKNTELKIQKNRLLPNTKKARSIPYILPGDVKSDLDRLIQSGHLERLVTIEEDCFVFPVVITVKKDKTVKLALDARKLNDSCIRKDHSCQQWTYYSIRFLPSYQRMN